MFVRNIILPQYCIVTLFIDNNKYVMDVLISDNKIQYGDHKKNTTDNVNRSFWQCMNNVLFSLGTFVVIVTSQEQIVDHGIFLFSLYENNRRCG